MRQELTQECVRVTCLAVALSTASRGATVDETCRLSCSVVYPFSRISLTVHIGISYPLSLANSNDIYRHASERPLAFEYRLQLRIQQDDHLFSELPKAVFTPLHYSLVRRHLGYVMVANFPNLKAGISQLERVQHHMPTEAFSHLNADASELTSY